ncbi:hypothetical protein HYU90_03395 [Candidatus Collierbacteria bacterium]|nr:hypothetical protein [Candidatus Collierbacteria bacterium]
MAYNASADRRCTNGKGAPQADVGLGDLDEVIAAEAAENGQPPRKPKNKRAVKEDPRWVIRIGLPADE